MSKLSINLWYIFYLPLNTLYSLFLKLDFTLYKRKYIKSLSKSVLPESVLPNIDSEGLEEYKKITFPELD